MNITDALRIIQKNERGRFYRERLIDALSTQMEQGVRQPGRIVNRGPQMPENEAAMKVQKVLRGIIARKRVEELRQDELVFLGMAPKPKTEQEKLNDPLHRRL